MTEIIHEKVSGVYRVITTSNGAFSDIPLGWWVTFLPNTEFPELRAKVVGVAEARHYLIVQCGVAGTVLLVTNREAIIPDGAVSSCKIKTGDFLTIMQEFGYIWKGEATQSGLQFLKCIREAYNFSDVASLVHDVERNLTDYSTETGLSIEELQLACGVLLNRSGRPLDEG